MLVQAMQNIIYLFYCMIILILNVRYVFSLAGITKMEGITVQADVHQDQTPGVIAKNDIGKLLSEYVFIVEIRQTIIM